jgi:hypothetical protein
MMKGQTMRVFALALVAALGAACTSSGPGDGDGDGDGSGSGDLMPPARGFQIETPEITIQPGEEITYCYYFRTPHTEAYAVKRWESRMTPGSHHLILYFTNDLKMPDGTLSSSPCGIMGAGSLTNLPQWIYSAQTSAADMQLPADDGAGKPLGMDVAAGQAAHLELHYVNRGDAPLVARAKINAEAHPAGVETTKTFAYVTYNATIKIPENELGHVETKTCSIPQTAKVWQMSTHAHQRAVKTEVRNGSEVVFTSTDWEHPGVERWMSAPFYQFSTGKLTYECTYDNPHNVEVRSGDSAQTDEMCMASGYIFPATKPMFCIDNFLLP